MKNYTSWIIVGAFVVVIFGGMIWYSSQPGKYDELATCISKSEARFFGAFWCPHCQEQKALFGKSARLLPYVECSTPNGQGQVEACRTSKIESYPTWIFKDGTMKTGVQTLADLASTTQCVISAQK